MLSELSGKRAIVTGGASGIGRAIVRLLVLQGVQTAVADIDLDRARAVAEEVGIDVAAVRETMARDGAVSPAIEESYNIAADLGLTGTPTYVIGDEVVVGAVGYDALRAKIDAMRECGATVC